MTLTVRRTPRPQPLLCAALAALTSSGCPVAHAPADDAGAAGALDAPPAPSPDAPAASDAPLRDALPADGPSAPDARPPSDAGPAPDAPDACAGLAPAACLGAGCVPAFDDACCRTCAPGGPCADCTDLEYHGCSAAALSPCPGGTGCGSAPAWACGAAVPTCATATVVDLDSCSVTGCVPAYPSGMGDPQIAEAVCVPIVAESCTVACRRLAPPCPAGTTPEGDGFCYTDRCIPDFVCR